MCHGSMSVDAKAPGGLKTLSAIFQRFGFVFRKPMALAAVQPTPSSPLRLVPHLLQRWTAATLIPQSAIARPHTDATLYFN